MSVQEQRDRVRGRVWQAIAQSGINLSSIPQDQVNKLADYITDGVLHELNSMLDDAVAQGAPRAAGTSGAPPAAQPPAIPGAQAAVGPGGPSAEAEQLLWEGRPFLSLVERYVVTNQRVRIFTGLIGHSVEDAEFIRIKDVDYTQGISERLLNIGDVQLHSVDASQPNLVLRNVFDPEKVHEIVRRAMLDARKRYPYIFAQEL